jgi:hypothetical protein
LAKTILEGLLRLFFAIPLLNHYYNWNITSKILGILFLATGTGLEVASTSTVFVLCVFVLACLLILDFSVSIMILSIIPVIGYRYMLPTL